jgi:hypothetical protein
MPMVQYGQITIHICDRINDEQAKAVSEVVTNHGISIMNALNKAGNVTVEFTTRIDIEVPFDLNVMTDCTDMTHEILRASGIIPDDIKITVESRFRS